MKFYHKALGVAFAMVFPLFCHSQESQLPIQALRKLQLLQIPKKPGQLALPDRIDLQKSVSQSFFTHLVACVDESVHIAYGSVHQNTAALVVAAKKGR